MEAKQSLTQNLRIIRIVVGSLLLGCIGMILYVWQSKTLPGAVSILGVALMIAGASLLSGGFLGFLFGIPRRLQNSDGSDENAKDEQPKSNEQKASYGANTNLEQISDWLTKILVGVGLTQISSLPDALQKYTEFAAPSLGNFPGNSTFALTLLIYYLIGGFLIGYLWTRLALAPALRQADLAALGGKLAEFEGKLTELEKQNAIDVKALNYIQGYLNSSHGAPPIAPTKEEIQEIINSYILPTSRNIKAQIFFQAQRVRSENWKMEANKPTMELTIPVFRALIKSDDRYHANHGQLGFALKDKKDPSIEDIKEAEVELTKAIELRGPWEDKGWLFYEFNRAVCRIKLDENFSKGRPSNEKNKEQIIADLTTAYNVDDLIGISENDPDISRWLKLNKVKIKANR